MNIRMGRHPKRVKVRCVLGIVAHPKLKNAMVSAAKRNRRSLSDECRSRLEQSMRDDEIVARLDALERRILGYASDGEGE